MAWVVNTHRESGKLQMLKTSFLGQMHSKDMLVLIDLIAVRAFFIGGRRVNPHDVDSHSAFLGRVKVAKVALVTPFASQRIHFVGN